MRRGEVWLGDLNPNRGAETGKIRPVLIVQADFLIAQGDPASVRDDPEVQAVYLGTGATFQARAPSRG